MPKSCHSPSGSSSDTSCVSYPNLTAGELAVGDAVRAGGLGAEALDLVLLVCLEVALEPEPVRAALPGEEAPRDPVEEPAVGGRDHGATGGTRAARSPGCPGSPRRGRWWARRAA